MRGRGRTPAPVGMAMTGTLFVHGLAIVLLFGTRGARTRLPPTYRVRLIAAPAPDLESRKAPEAFERPAEDKPAPIPAAKRPQSTVSRATPPPTRDQTQREAAPRTTSPTTPLPGEKPSTGNDVATVSTEGVEFPFPEYLQNMMSQVLRLWPPEQKSALEAEVSFFIHRDGSVTGLQFVRRSGSFPFDLEAQGVIEEAGNRHLFGALPDGWKPDVLYVRFYFAPRR
jgi:periplasmic protein TonB